MNTLLYNLCDNRSVFVPIDKVQEFVAFANQQNIHPEGGIISPKQYDADEDTQCFHLNNPMSREEALIIADRHHLKGVVEELINGGMSPFDALSQWDLNE